MFKVSTTMSKTFTLYGKSSELSSTFFPPIELDSTASYALGLVGFYSYNSIPNIDKSNNKFIISEGDKGQRKTIEIPIGSYEIEDIERYINNNISIYDNAIRKESDQKEHIRIKPNNNTLRCELYSNSFTIHFNGETIGSLLGFKEGMYTSKTLHKSDMPVNIVKVTSIRVECNITTDAYYNGQLSHTLYEFPIDVPPGYSIQNVAKNVIYMPINTYSISNITLTVCDQDGDPANFQGENIVIRLELKKL